MQNKKPFFVFIPERKYFRTKFKDTKISIKWEQMEFILLSSVRNLSNKWVKSQENLELFRAGVFYILCELFDILGKKRNEFLCFALDFS